MTTEYQEFLSHKQRVAFELGYRVDDGAINPILFPFQRDVVRWAVSKGRAAIFLDTGLGKTFIQLEWARLMNKKTLIIAPLSVARQTIREAKKINIDVKYVRSMDDLDGSTIYITNYELIEHFDMDSFEAVVLDESSILKAISGKTRQLLTERCENIQYRLCCTATPAPNDYTEIGNHAEFLGICSTQEMLGQFFINANKEHTFIIEGKAYHRKGSNAAGTEWRLKHHAEEPFFRWLASWAITMIKPSDLGYDDDGFILPELFVEPIFVNAKYTPADQLFFTNLHGIEDRNKVRRITLQKRLQKALELIKTKNEQWIIWCGLDDESKALMNAIPDAREVKGSDDPEYKAKTFEDFQDGKFNILITKAKIGGYGMNFQNAHNMIFFGMNDSWELYYQAIRREWRYRQESPVYVYLVLSELEDAIYKNVMRKDAMAKRLRTKLIEQILGYERLELSMENSIYQDYKEDTVKGKYFTAMMGDSCKRLSEIEDNSIDMTVYSPPFADLFVYSASERDLGNSKNSGEFFEHYKYIIRELLRVTKPGRISCVHTSDIPAMAQKDGYIGIKDFPGDVIRAHIEAGWIFAGRAFVQKNPQAQAIRTKSKALLFVQLRKDSSDSRPALVDQVLMFSKPGENDKPITPVEHGELDNDKWIEWANGIWLGISESDTLQFTTARGTGDEKHICPLQLGTIERCIKLYSNPGETILSPFMGIGSEIYQAIRFGRKGIGIELKDSYFKIAVNNLKTAESTYHQDLFTWNSANQYIEGSNVR
jgi:DNA modification methylase/superfamily II DNA or RNA helicase